MKCKFSRVCLFVSVVASFITLATAGDDSARDATDLSDTAPEAIAPVAVFSPISVEALRPALNAAQGKYTPEVQKLHLDLLKVQTREAMRAEEHRKAVNQDLSKEKE